MEVAEPTLPGRLVLAAVLVTLALAVPSSTAGTLHFGPPLLVIHIATPVPVLQASAPPLSRPAASVDNLREDGDAPDVIALTWAKSQDTCFDNYTLEESSSGSNGPWTAFPPITNEVANNTIVSTSNQGAAYWFELVDSDCNGNATSSVLPVTEPAPAQLAETQLSASSAQFSWNNGANYSGLVTFQSYAIYESLNGGSFNTVATVHSESDQEYNVTGIPLSTNLSFYVVTFESCSGCSLAFGSPSNQVSFGTPAPLAATTAVSRSSADVGEPVQFTCTTSGGAAPFHYSWTFGDGTSAAGQNASHVYANPGFEAATCSVQDRLDSRTSSMVGVSVSPALSVVAHANHLRAAPEVSLNFTADATGGPGGVIGLAWEFGDGEMSSGGSTSHSYARAGTFNATVFATDANGVTAEASVNVTVTDLSIASKAATTQGVPSTLFWFTASASGGGGAPYSFVWSFGDQSGGFGSTTHHTYSSPGDYAVTVTATDGVGESSTTTVAMVRVYAPLDLVITLAPNSPSPGQSIELTAGISGGSGGGSCQWNFGDSSTAFGCQTRHDWARTGTYTVNLTVADSVAGNVSTVRTVVVSTTGSPLGPELGGIPVILVAAPIALVAIVGALIIWRRFMARRGPPPGGAW